MEILCWDFKYELFEPCNKFQRSRELVLSIILNLSFTIALFVHMHDFNYKLLSPQKKNYHPWKSSLISEANLVFSVKVHC